MKLIGFEEMEGGIILHCPSGKRKVCPLSDDADKVAAAIGAMVMETLVSDGEPLARLDDVADAVDAELDDAERDDDDDEYEEEERPRRRRRRRRRSRRTGGSAMSGVDARMRGGESAEQYVNRVGSEAGFHALKLLWRGLQRASGTRPPDED